MRDGKEKYELFLRHPNIHPFLKLDSFFSKFHFDRVDDAFTCF